MSRPICRQALGYHLLAFRPPAVLTIFQDPNDRHGLHGPPLPENGRVKIGFA